ncbi:WXG100 family type VII secretion target [Streptomyces sp. NPDC048483]|uniref:WXG100 family type VII secretion target n=1 Tax=Streptomyces sp. NPDC048483 TaxID=3154927 RepID=UPI0034222602
MSERRNPEALHEAAAGWRDMGKHLDGLVEELDRHVGNAAAAHWQGPAGEAFAGEWHRLKRSVDDSLPAFELAAADLELAAAQPAEKDSTDGGGDHGSNGSASSSGGQQSGTNFAYGFMALGQLANGLGGAFRKRGGGGGGGQRGPAATHRWEGSTAVHGPDPFGAQNGGGKARGGENIAKGARTDPAAAAEQAAKDSKDAKATESKATDAKPAKASTSEPPASGTFG